MAYRLFDAEGKLGLDASEMRRELRAAHREVEKTMKQIDGAKATAEIDADIDDVEEKMKRAQALLAKWRQQRANAKAGIETEEITRKIQKTEQQLKRLDGRKARLHIALSENAKGVEEGLKRISRHAKKMGDDTERVARGPLQRLGDKLNQARVTMGPLSLSLRAFTMLLGATAPMVVNLVGSLTSLVGVLGTGLTGAAGLGGAALLGVGGAMGLMFSSIKANKKVFEPLKKDAKEFGKEWGKLTKAGAHGFSHALQRSLKNVEGMLPGLAKRTNSTFAIMGKGAERFTKMLSSKEGSGNIDKILGNANKMLAPVLRGFTNLGQVALRVFGSFSRFLPEMGKGFEGWTKGLLKSTDNAGKLDRGVGRIVRHAKEVGRFFLEAGRAVKDVFNVAADSGVKPLKSMTESMKDIQRWAKTPGAKEFFENARKGSERVVNALREFVPIIGKWITAMQPFSAAFLDILTTAGKLLNKFLELVGGGEELMTVLAGLYVLRRAMGWAKGIRDALMGTKLASGITDLLLGRGKGGKPGKGGGPPVVVPTGLPDGKDGDKKGKSWARRFLSAVKRPFAGLAGAIGLGGLAAKLSGAFKRLKLPNIGGLFKNIKVPSGVGGKLASGLKFGFTKALGVVGIGYTINNWIQGGLKKVGDSFKGDSTASKIGRVLFTKKGFEDAVDSATGGVKNKIKSLFRGNQDGVWKYGKQPKIPKGQLDFGTQLAREMTAIRRLERSVSGRKFLVRIDTRGGQMARRTLQVLSTTRLGRKTLYILSRGGPGAVRLMRNLGQTQIGRKLLRIIERGGPNARRVLRALQNTKLREKVQRILEKGGPNVRRALERILGIKFRKKTQDVEEKGSQAVRDKILKLAGMKLGDKTTTLKANDQASGIINNIKSALSSIKDKVVNIFTRKRGKATGGIEVGYASGGSPDFFSGSPVTERIHQQAMKRKPLQAGGGIVREPTMLAASGAVTGEERRTEIVIATNPAYKHRNRKLFKIAGRMLGMRGFQQGGIAGDVQGFQQGGDTFAQNANRQLPGGLGGATYTPVTGNDVAAMRPTGRQVRGNRRKGLIKMGGLWGQHIARLQGRETDLEREASIRESQVREPDSLLKEVGMAEDGVTPVMAIDWPEIKRYLTEMKRVMDVYYAINQVVGELHRVLPQAIAAKKEEIVQRNASINILRGKLKVARQKMGREEARKVRRNGRLVSGTRPSVIRRLRKQIEGHEKGITGHGQAIGDAKTSIGEMGAEWKDSGFRIRESWIRAENYKRDSGGVIPRAQKELADHVKGVASNVTTNAPLQQQSFGQARYDLLANFGSNAASLSPGAGTPLGGGFQAMQGGFKAGGMAEGSLRMMGAAMASPIVGAMQGAVVGAGGKTINVTNNYAGGPEDAHTWSQRQKWELSATGF